MSSSSLAKSTVSSPFPVDPSLRASTPVSLTSLSMSKRTFIWSPSTPKAAASCDFVTKPPHAAAHTARFTACIDSIEAFECSHGYIRHDAKEARHGRILGDELGVPESTCIPLSCCSMGGVCSVLSSPGCAIGLRVVLSTVYTFDPRGTEDEITKNVVQIGFAHLQKWMDHGRVAEWSCHTSAFLPAYGSSVFSELMLSGSSWATTSFSKLDWKKR